MKNRTINPHNFPQILLLFVIGLASCNPNTPNITQDESITQASKSAVKSILNNTLSTKTKKAPAVLYRSLDQGATWTTFANGIPNEATASAIQQAANKIYVATDYHGIFVSTNGQDNWTVLNKKQLADLDINCLGVGDNHLIIGTLNQGILISRDGGFNWHPSIGNISAPIRAFQKLDNTIYAGTDSGIFKSEDRGATWSHHFGAVQILGFTTLNGRLYAATQSGALLKESDDNWKSIYDGGALHDIANDGQNIYAMTIDQQLLKTKNDGRSWENAQSGLTRPPNYYTNELIHLNQDIFSAQWIGIYHSADHGNNWRMLEGLPDSVAFSTLKVTGYGIIAGVSIR